MTKPPSEEPEMYFPTLTGAGAMPSMDEDAPLAAEVAKGARRKKAGSFRYGDRQGGRRVTTTDSTTRF